MMNPDAAAPGPPAPDALPGDGSGAPAPDALPAAVRRKLEAAHEWLRRRDAVLADRLLTVPVRPGARVLLAMPDNAGAIHVNPEALLSLSPEEVAGALVGSVLALPPEVVGGLEARRELVERVERVRRGLDAV